MHEVNIHPTIVRFPDKEGIVQRYFNRPGIKLNVMRPPPCFIVRMPLSVLAVIDFMFLCSDFNYLIDLYDAFCSVMFSSKLLILPEISVLITHRSTLFS